MNIRQQPSPNRNIGRSGWTPDFIVCHITEGSFDGAVSWIVNPASQVSYHFVVARDGRITQAVDIANTAWANGTTNSGDSRDNRHSRLDAVRSRRVNANLYTISIGFEGRSTETAGALADAQLDAAIWLIGHIRKEAIRLFGKVIPVENIVGHADITPRWKPNCPGANFPFKEIQNRVETPPPVVPQPPPQPIPSPWAKEAWEWAVANKLTDGTNPQGIPTREQMIKLLHNYSTMMP